MRRVISVLPSEGSTDEEIKRIKASLKGLGEIVEGLGEEPGLIVIHDPDGNLHEAAALMESYPKVRILLVTDKESGNRARRQSMDEAGGRISVVDCGNGGLRYEAELVMDIMDAPEKYRSLL